MTTGRQVPFCLFTDPEMARVGLSEAEAKDARRRLPPGENPMLAVLRTRTLSETRGFLKALIEPNGDRILGFTAFGVEAGEVMAVVQVAMAAGLPCTALRDMVLTHPTIAEGLVALLFSRAGQGMIGIEGEPGEDRSATGRDRWPHSAAPARHGIGPAPAWRPSCGPAAAGQEDSRLRLEDCDDFASQNVALVLGPFLGRKFALVALVGQLVHADLGLGVRLEADELRAASSLSDGADGIEQAFEDSAVCCFHIDRIRRMGSCRQTVRVKAPPLPSKYRTAVASRSRPMTP